MGTEASAQYIEVGPVKVDTGHDWLDFGFAITLMLIIIVAYKYIPTK